MSPWSLLNPKTASDKWRTSCADEREDQEEHQSSMESLVPLRGNIACHIQYPPTLEAPEHTSSPLQSLQAILFLHDQSKGPDSLERIEELFGVVIDTSLEDDNSQPVWKQ